MPRSVQRSNATTATRSGQKDFERLKKKPTRHSKWLGERTEARHSVFPMFKA